MYFSCQGKFPILGLGKHGSPSPELSVIKI